MTGILTLWNSISVTKTKRQDQWSPEEDRILTELWSDPKFTANQIGQQMVPPRTKNAIIGRAGRIGLPKKKRVRGGIGAKLCLKLERRKPRRKSIPPQPMLDIFPEPLGFDPIRVPLLEAGFDHCRAIVESSSVSRSGQTIVCGHSVPMGQPYMFCKHHLAIYTAPRPSRRR